MQSCWRLNLRQALPAAVTVLRATRAAAVAWAACLNPCMGYTRTLMGISAARAACRCYCGKSTSCVQQQLDGSWAVWIGSSAPKHASWAGPTRCARRCSLRRSRGTLQGSKQVVQRAQPIQLTRIAAHNCLECQHPLWATQRALCLHEQETQSGLYSGLQRCAHGVSRIAGGCPWCWCCAPSCPLFVRASYQCVMSLDVHSGSACMWMVWVMSDASVCGCGDEYGCACYAAVPCIMVMWLHVWQVVVVLRCRLGLFWDAVLVCCEQVCTFLLLLSRCGWAGSCPD